MVEKLGIEQQFPYIRDGRLLALYESDKGRGGDFLATIVSYIECGFNLGITANAMHLHRNSMVYRLSRIVEKSGIDLLGSPQNYDLIALLITAKLYLSRL